MPIPETRPYFEAVEGFLSAIQSHKVTSLCLVALCSDEDESHNVVSKWQAGPFETMTAAGVLQLHAGLQYNEINVDYDDDDEDDDA